MSEGRSGTLSDPLSHPLGVGEAALVSGEVLNLAAAGIRFHVIPGITAGVAAPAMAGIPVTDRAVNSSIAFLTGHCH